jgi:hypothetical protein
MSQKEFPRANGRCSGSSNVINLIPKPGYSTVLEVHDVAEDHVLNLSLAPQPARLDQLQAKRLHPLGFGGAASSGGYPMAKVLQMNWEFR